MTDPPPPSPDAFAVATRAQLAVDELGLAALLRQRAEDWPHTGVAASLLEAADHAEAVVRVLLADPAVAERAQAIRKELGDGN
jgi:hypothetical protein